MIIKNTSTVTAELQNTFNIVLNVTSAIPWQLRLLSAQGLTLHCYVMLLWKNI